MEAWLKCEVSLGQFDTEAAVRFQDHNGDDFSLFVPREDVCVESNISVSPIEGSFRVDILDQRDDLRLIYLPVPTFGNGHSVTVRASQLTGKRDTHHV
ncbi:MAG: hypothetical protein AB7I37_15135 [Pirellulales bacterium]